MEKLERYKPLFNERKLNNSQKDFEECMKQLDIMVKAMWKYFSYKFPESFDEPLYPNPLYEVTETGKRILVTFKNAKYKLDVRIDRLDDIDKPLKASVSNNSTTLQNKSTKDFYNIVEGLDDDSLELYHQIDDEDKIIIKNMWKEYIESIKKMNLKIEIYNKNYPKNKINLLEVK